MDNNYSTQSSNEYEEHNYKNKSNGNKPLILLLVLLLLGAVGYIVFDKINEGKSLKDNDKAIDSVKGNTDKDKDKTDKPVELSINDSLVKSLYDMTKPECDFFSHFYYDAAETLRSNIKETDLFPNITMGGCPIGGGFQKKVVSAKKYSDKVEIYEKHIYTALDSGPNGETIYTVYPNVVDFSDKNSVSNSLGTFTYNEQSQSAIDSYLDKAPSYIFTFNKQSDGTYTFYSIKKVA
jgi:hypothetical protein